MSAVRSVYIEGVERPTYDSLVKHFDRYGLDNSKKGYRSTPLTYKSYAALAKDSLVEVAYDYLGVETYVALIERIGYGQYKDKARADWLEGHEGEA